MTWSPSASLLEPLAPWFEGARRDLPWRAKDLDGPHTDPYAVLVSELMLQQTQVATVIPYFERWMERFPTARALAAADDDAVHKAWEGLGYYRRCRLLKAASAEVAAKGWPADLEGLSQLPGLGPYTAAALGSIAFQWPTPALDGNAFRVLSRLLLMEGDPKAKAAELRPWLAPALAAHGPSRMTQAIMELGATVCLPTPKCEGCPLSPVCAARLAGRTAEIPPIAKRAKPKEESLWLLAVEAEDHFLLHAPAASGLLAGLWRWPTVGDGCRLPASGHGAAEDVAGYQAVDLRAWEGWTQVYTHRREQVSPLHVRLPKRFEAAEGLRWVGAHELAGLPLGRRDGRLRDLLPRPGQAPLEAPSSLLQGLMAGRPGGSGLP